jgi:hypothetical protein
VVEESGVPGENHRPWQATGKLDQLWLWVECTLFVIYKYGHEPTTYWWLFELLGNPTTQLIEPPGPCLFKLEKQTGTNYNIANNMHNLETAQHDQHATTQL